MSTRKANLSIKKLLLIWLISSIGTMVALFIISFIANRVLSSGIHTLGHTIIPLEESALKLSNTIVGYLERQSSILTSESQADWQNIPSGDNLKKQFNTEIDNIKALKTSNLQPLNELEQSFVQHVKIDNELYQLKKETIDIDETLKKTIINVNEKIKKTQANADSIAGRAALSSKRASRKVKKALKKNNTSFKEFKSLASDMALGESAQVSSTSNKLKENMSQMSIAVQKIELTDDPDLLVSIRDNTLKQLIISSLQYIDTLRPRMGDIRNGEALLRELEASILEINKIVVTNKNSLFVQRESFLKKHQELSDLSERVTQQNQNLRKNLSALTKYGSELTQTTRKSTSRIADNSLLGIIFVAISLSLILLILGSNISRRITSSLQHIQNAMFKVSKGDLTANIDVQGNDEFGKLSCQINNAVDDLRRSLSLVKETGDNISTSSKDLSLTADQASQNLGDQMTQADLISSAMEKMASSVDDIAASTSETAETTRTTADEVSEGNEIVSTSLQSIEELASDVDDAQKVIQALEESAQKIGNVIGVIRGISEQTNLLALNAAIEAARAGDSGRGFAVVADEVRSLAQKTQDSTLEIEAVIETIQQGTGMAVEAMNKGKSSAHNGVENSINAKERLDKIANDIKHINKMNLQIAASAEHQRDIAKEMHNNIQFILEATGTSLKSSKVVANNSELLAGQSQGLDLMLSRYTL